MTTGAGTAAPRRRVRVHVTGVVQGVGFRPFVFRLAAELVLDGTAHNDAQGLLIDVEGAPAAVDRFLARLVAEAPPLAVIDHVAVRELATLGRAGFAIAPSERAGAGATTADVAPDIGSCAACLAELFDPADRRFRYPFINCTDCGPRFTIVRGLPYDRAQTTMAPFRMCAPCQAEYEDPRHRRFHAQPNACPACGPRARLVDRDGTAVATAAPGDAVAAAARALLDGAIVAVKGLGGYHLACRADREDAVRRLRARKQREHRPFALMVADQAAAMRLVELDAAESALLLARERPILLARRRRGAAVARSVAPRQRDLGVMLPATPLHHLLTVDAGVPLVMTSGNRSSEPIAHRDDDALARLGELADLFLVHDRAIETRVDDSVVRVVTLGGERHPLLLRRSRGWVPAALPLPVPCDAPTLATGSQLKNTFAFARGGRAWVGHHIGDLDEPATRAAFDDGIAHLGGLLAIAPARVAHDLHPDYHATRWALDHGELPATAVQHHHAHLAACLAEHGERGPAVGIVLDGTGYGTDGTVWGGELLVGDLVRVERAGHLWPVRMPGGEAAIREPWRMACAWLATLGPELPPLPATLATQVTPAQWAQVARLARRGLASPLTTSAGRLLDALSALCGVRARISYEGQAAIELEMLAASCAEPVVPYTMGTCWMEDRLVLDARELVRAVAADVAAGVPVELSAARAHCGLAHATANAACELAARHAVDVVVLTGGVFQNVLLLERTAELLVRRSLRVLVPRRLPPNDGGLSYGQLAVTAARAALAAHSGRRTPSSGA